MKALIIEDDIEIVESVSIAFRMGWPEAQLLSAHLGKKGIRMAESQSPDIIILDLGLPDISGFEVLKRIRSVSSVPIIILTVKKEEASVVKGLEWGADDYIVKPCGQFELLARIKARIRDADYTGKDEPITIGAISFDPLIRIFKKGKKQVKLTAIESHIIHHLMKNADRVATYSRLAEDVWGDDYIGSVDSLRVHVRRLRGKIEEDPSHPELILTKSGIGYYLAKPSRM